LAVGILPTKKLVWFPKAILGLVSPIVFVSQGYGWSVFSEIIYHSDTFQHFSKSTFRFCPPEDGFPVCEDWVSTLESMMFGGVELQREPLDGSVEFPAGLDVSTKSHGFHGSQFQH
jgi:hypothetical protein